ncbi:MAG: hypothetical protein K2X86_18140 [Cytophagaceae bacterium]|nr:hypothetical protein [Cytophagaceae bacterium]
MRERNWNRRKRLINLETKIKTFRELNGLEEKHEPDTIEHLHVRLKASGRL